MATLNTRLKLKYDIYENWSAAANQFKLLEGEVAFCYIPDAIDAVHNPPTLMYKVGDGNKTFNQLSWGSALASDVYNWAKQQYAPVASLGGTDGVVVTKTTGTNAHTAKANLKDYTRNAASATKSTTTKVYAVELDKDGHLAVAVPWTNTDTNTAHTHSKGAGLVVTGSGGTSGNVEYKAALVSETPNTNEAPTPVKNADRLYPVEVDKNGKLAVTVPWTDTNTTSFNITATATDDDVVILTGTGGANSVSYDAKHAKKGPTSEYTKDNSTATISGSGGAGTIKIPKITVDTYGHVTSAEDESVVITLPTVNKSAVGLDKVENKALDTAVTANSSNYITSGAVKSYVDTEIGKIDQFQYVVSTNAATTPKDVIWYSSTAQVTGTLTASANTEYIIYLVPCKHSAAQEQKGYDEYLTVKNGSTYSWEVLGNTRDIDLSGYVPTSRTINNKALTGNITLTASDVGVNETAFPGLKKTGTVTSVTAGDGLATDSGNSITTSGTIKHATPSGAAVKDTGLYKIKTDKFGHVTGATAVAKADITGLGIPGADTNQKVTAKNASGTDVAFGANDTVAIRAGSNVTVVADTTADTITISATAPNNGKLKDGVGTEIFSANASADVQILVIDCGSATTVNYNVD